jgi:hypothetical protein
MVAIMKFRVFWDVAHTARHYIPEDSKQHGKGLKLNAKQFIINLAYCTVICCQNCDLGGFCTRIVNAKEPSALVLSQNSYLMLNVS